MTGLVQLASSPDLKAMCWQVPKFETLPSERIGWIDESIQEGEGAMRYTKPFKNLGRNMRIFNGIFKDRARSGLYSNSLRYNIRKMVETISDIREIGTYGSDAPQFKEYAEVLNRTSKAIYLEGNYPRQLRKALQYAFPQSVGYLWPKCHAGGYGFKERKIIFEPLGMMRVVPVQMPSSNDIQEAYTVHVFVYMPIAEAHARFPAYQSQLQPLGYRTSNLSTVGARRLDSEERYQSNEGMKGWGELTCELRYTFIRDIRINTTGYELPMGKPDSSWFYKVPSVGQQILGGIRNGQPFMRPAENEDCLVYPQLRLMISSRDIDEPIYDGPAFDWHGEMPPVQYVVDDLPWEPLGNSLIDSVGSIEDTKRKHERLMDQAQTARLDPTMAYDRTATGGPKIENLDIFERSARIGLDGEPRDILQSIIPDSVTVGETNYKWWDLLDKMETSQLGINDMSGLEDLKFNLGGDGFDKALATVGPIAKAIAGNVETGNAKVAHMMKFMIPQWMDTKRIVQYVGPDNIPSGIFDYDPSSLIPSHGLDEGWVNTDGEWKAPEATSQYPQLQRAKRFAENIRLISVPSTLLKITQQEEQIKYMSLYGRGAPISFHTVAKKLNIENYGEIEGTTEFEKWINEQKAMILLKGDAAKLAEQVGLDGPPPVQGKQHAGGRPPTDQKPGKLKMKDKNSGAPRPIISTSG
jgi:hypothetical protein